MGKYYTKTSVDELTRRCELAKQAMELDTTLSSYVAAKRYNVCCDTLKRYLEEGTLVRKAVTTKPPRLAHNTFRSYQWSYLLNAVFQ